MQLAARLWHSLKAVLNLNEILVMLEACKQHHVFKIPKHGHDYFFCSPMLKLMEMRSASD